MGEIVNFAAGGVALVGGMIELSTVLIMLGCVLLCVVMLRAWARARRRANESSATRLLRRASTFEAEASQASLEQLITDLQEYSRDVLAKLDTKARVLSRLIVDADQRISKLQQLIGSTNHSAGPAEADYPSPVAASEAGDSVVLSGTSQQASRKLQDTKVQTEPAKQAVLPDLTSSRTEPPDERQVSLKYEKIWAMRAAGRNSAQIAADLDIPRGEVELVLAMQSAQREGE